jgi:hypothetical protein
MENTVKTKFCPHCGTELNGARFCPNCGEAINKTDDKQVPNSAFSKEQLKLQKGDLLNAVRSIQGRTLDLIGAGVAIVFIILQFCNWFIVSMGGFGVVADYFFDGVSSSMISRYSVCTLLPAMIKLAKLAGASTATELGIIFAIVLVIIGIVGIYHSIYAIKAVYNRKSATDRIEAIATVAIIEALFAMICVWILKGLMSYAMEESGLGVISSATSDVVSFTKIPIIMLVMGVLCKLVFGAIAKESKLNLQYEQYEALGDTELMQVYFSSKDGEMAQRIAKELLDKREGVSDGQIEERMRVWDILINNSDEELQEIIANPNGKEINKTVAKEILNKRRQLQ